MFQIKSMKEIKQLECMISLRDLSFCDTHFGNCPFTNDCQYRERIIRRLHQVRSFAKFFDCFV